MKTTTRISIFAFTLLQVFNLQATRYYVSSTGVDGNNGKSEVSPWQTITKVNATTFAAGDTISFKGGETFSGKLTPSSSGTASNSIIFNSYGTGRATISAGTGTGVSCSNKNYITITNINFTGAGGSGSTANSGNGITQSGGTGCTFDQINITGFTNGILLSNSSTNTRVTFIDASNLRGTGFRSQGSKYTHVNLYIADSKFYNCGGIDQSNKGSGIELAQVNGAIVERCVAHDTGITFGTPGGGPVGMWCWQAKNVTFQYCESYNNKSNDVDGGGFDLDGGSVGCIIQYCYSHGNRASGYFCANWSTSELWENNTIRYCISENDALGTDGGYTGTGGINIWGSCNGTGYIYGNTIYASQKAGSDAAICIESSGAQIKFYNNIIITQGTVPLVRGSNPTFRNNLYYNTDNIFYIDGGNNIFTSIASWAAATGQEKVGGVIVGKQANPLFNNFTPGVTLNDVSKLANMGQYLPGYKLNDNSPAINAGIDLSLTTNIPLPGPGARDFFGNAIPYGGSYDIGVFESNKITSIFEIASTSDIKSHATNGMIITDLSRVNGKSTVTIYDARGTLIKTLETTANQTNISVPFSGVYLVRVTNNGNVIAQKVIV